MNFSEDENQGRSLSFVAKLESIHLRSILSSSHKRITEDRLDMILKKKYLHLNVYRTNWKRIWYCLLRSKFFKIWTNRVSDNFLNIIIKENLANSVLKIKAVELQNKFKILILFNQSNLTFIFIINHNIVHFCCKF